LAVKPLRLRVVKVQKPDLQHSASIHPTQQLKT
jgi:hypothetical protein